MVRVWGNPRWRRLLMWALRLSSPSRATLVLLQRRARGETDAELSFEDGCVSLREAWLGRFELDD